MFDARLRPYIDLPLNAAARFLAARGIHANMLTGAGLACGLLAAAALALQLYIPALLLILLSRLLDGLDGPVARHMPQGASDVGAFYDIVADFIFYSAVVFGFALGRPETALAAAFLLFSFAGSGGTFLTYAIIAAGRGINHDEQGEKSFYYLAGLCEGAETIVFFILFCLLPDYFTALAILFGILCWLTAAGRVLQARRDFS